MYFALIAFFIAISSFVADEQAKMFCSCFKISAYTTTIFIYQTLVERCLILQWTYYYMLHPSFNAK